MTDPINPMVQQVLDHIAEKPAEVAPQPPSADNVAQFQEAMAQGGSPPNVEAAATQVTPPGQANVVAGPEPTTPSTIGDAILQSMEKIRDSHEMHVRNIEGLIKPDTPMSTENMLKMQMEMTSMSLETELVGNVVDKGDKTVQTLFKEG